MESLESELDRARTLSVSDLADAIESIGFECTRCGACCKGYDDEDGEHEPHTATVFPEEVRTLTDAADDGDESGDSGGTGTTSDSSADTSRESRHDGGTPDPRPGDERAWRDVARPMPYGLHEGPDGPEGETFEWALQTDGCGDCTFYAEGDDGRGACTVHESRPLICRTYPFSVALAGTSQPMGEVVESVALPARREVDDPDEPDGVVRAHECEGLGRDISRADAEELAAALQERAVRELEEAIAVRDNYETVDRSPGDVVVHDSEGAKRPDGTPW
ncbi:YkgJ family cysteine cluster protein [Halomarina oriensis]|uniref:YkgJ family cysteine cluster protein n=1 Tax=Halomarina oriensis TaxID=671145 RepID=A0A6B0GND5_9EURY|nr:YkgJ family cysteine cluster protein [Halomarina oriensis]MWG35461.1 YkgJ family cysteine cluster protein [Halomarina oriensis]